VETVTSTDWDTSEVIAYVEDKILSDTETADEMEWYEDYKLSGIIKNNYTYKNLIREMNNEWNG
jgi:hypothetical protein